jgi:SAM-dependent methyltransferase
MIRVHTLGGSMPEWMKTIVRPVRNRLLRKSAGELAFWKSRLEDDHGRFQNSHYERLLLAIAGEDDAGFLEGKIVADFGCGPRGSLAWASGASMRIGIDVLADRYADEFTSNILSHGMVYLKSTERVIPLPPDFVDVLFTVNAVDHVDNFLEMCGEIFRVLKPAGLFVGSFNLEEPPAPTEPQRLNEGIIKEHLLDRLEVETYRLAPRPRQGNVYAPFFEGGPPYLRGEDGFLWVRARKPAAEASAPLRGSGGRDSDG